MVTSRSPRQRLRSVRPSGMPVALGVAFACLCGASWAAEHAEPDARPDAHAMEHGQEAVKMDHGEMNRGEMMSGTPADTGAEVTGPMHGRTPELARISAAGLYRVELRGLPDPVPLNRMHEWVVHVETVEGAPVEGASITMDGGMPVHDHGLPTAPRVTAELGGGDYRLEGVRFQMGGHWVVELAIDAAPGGDSVAFDLNL